MRQPDLRHVYRAGTLEFDEARHELRVGGQLRAIEAKPRALLHALLKSAGGVATKRALVQAVWGNADHISEASLTTAMFKLRNALGEQGRDLIEVVHGSGYRITEQVEVTIAREAPRLAFTFVPGEPVPGRTQWHLERVLGAAPLNDVWLARHAKTHDTRVFKFADSDARLEALRREAALARVLHATLGARDDLVRIMEWNFDERPYFIESAYGGLDLLGWAEAQGGLAAMALEVRVGIAAQVAHTIAAAHAAGVLHGDIKPGNILVAPESNAEPRTRLVDFGAGGPSDTGRLADLAISLRGLESESADQPTGTLRYLAPEVLAGGAQTAAADVYALGILLFQLVAGDFNKPLSVDWERTIDDPLLREDIATAAAGDPGRRFSSAANLARRLDRLVERRAALLNRQRVDREAAALARRMERDRLRRPWVMAASLCLVTGLLLSTLFGLQALRDRDLARRDAELAHAVNGFLTKDLLGRGNPAQSGKADETLMQAAEAAEAGIDKRLDKSPLIAGAIYLALAQAFDSRTAYDAARRAYGNAITSFRKAGEAGSASMVIALLQAACLEVVSGQPGSMDRASHMITEAAPRIPDLGSRRKESETWLHEARGFQQMQGGDVRTAQAEYKAAADAADTMPAVFDTGTRLALRQREAFTHLRLGDWAVAARLFSDLVQQRMTLNGPRNADTLTVELNLAQVHVAQGQYAAALPVLNELYPDIVAVFGKDHRRTLQLLATRGQALMQLQRYDDAYTDEMTIYRSAVATQGDHSFFAVGTLADAAQSKCRAGQAEPGLSAARSAHAAAIAAFGKKNALTGYIQGVVSFCLIVAGQYDQAAPLLDGIDTQAVAQLTADPAYGSGIDLMRVDIDLKTGRAAAGTALLKKAALAFEQPGADTYMRQWARQLWPQQDGLKVNKK